jgi:DNA modification methylase
MYITPPLSPVMINKKILSRVETKPYFQKGDFVLYHGDSLSILAQLPENSIDMIFADPPYNLSNGGFSVVCFKFSEAYTLINVFAYLLWTSIYLSRTYCEERFLMQFEEYRVYCERVKYRLIPGVY